MKKFKKHPIVSNDDELMELIISNINHENQTNQTNETNEDKKKLHDEHKN
jgi:phage terminase large subunit-like protein